MPSGDEPFVVVVSGPSGVGKDAVLARVRERAPFAVPVTMTTRAPREGEVDGRDYHFVTREAFDRAIAAGEMLEYAEVYGNYYGVPRSELRKALEAGQDVIVRVDVQGVRTLRTVIGGAIFVFLVPDRPDHLEAQLRGRGAADEADLARRLRAAEEELAARDEFDHIVVNVHGDLDAAATAILEIIASERGNARREPVRV